MAAKTGTYTLIDSNTLGSAAASVTFSSIPSTYTDLILVCSMYATTNDSLAYIQLGNGSADTGSNYSFTTLFGNGTTAASARNSNNTGMLLLGYDYGIGSTNNVFVPLIASIMDYANTTTNKTVLARSYAQRNDGNNQIFSNVGLWRSTSAINVVKVYLSAGNLAAGSTFKLYGIEAAK
jgi:hypothetical protein